MLAYLRAGGFSTVVSDKDFPMSMRASKWGAPDHAVFERALNDARTAGAAPRFSVVQTSSSHEMPGLYGSLKHMRYQTIYPRGQASQASAQCLLHRATA